MRLSSFVAMFLSAVSVSAQWHMTLVYRGQHAYHNSDFLPKDCVMLNDGPQHVDFVTFDDSGFTWGYRLFSDSHCAYCVFEDNNDGSFDVQQTVGSYMIKPYEPHGEGCPYTQGEAHNDDTSD